jgi:hypothetical protein
MQLKTHGDELAMMGRRAMLTAEYTPGDRGPGRVALSLVDQDTGEASDTALQLDPWSGDVYEVFEWSECGALILCGAPQVVALALPELGFGAAVGLEYEEAETLDHPWFVEVPELRLLVVATERRMWCLDERLAIRWLWSARTQHDDRWLHGPPRAVGRDLVISTRTLHRDREILVSADRGIERALDR